MSRVMQRRIATLLVGLVIAGGWLFTGMLLMRAQSASDTGMPRIDLVEPAAGIRAGR
ncbi:MAG: hypothetical protein AB7K86_13100 [Rhodospirillales bacterium]